MANGFEFLEGVVTPEVLEQLQKDEAARARRISASMGSAERAGFGVGRALFGGLSGILPGGRRRQEREEAKANAAAMKQASADVREQTFEGPESGHQERVAMFEALERRFRESGNQQDALRAQIAATDARTELENARLRRRQANLNIDAQRANLRLSELRQRGEEMKFGLQKNVWPVTTDDEGNVQFGAPVDRSTAAGETEYEARLQDGEFLVTYDDAVRFYGDNFLNTAAKSAFTSMPVEGKRETMEGALKLYDTAIQFAGIVSEAPIDPTSDVGTATKFINRIQQNFRAGGAVVAQMREDQLMNDVHWQNAETWTEQAMQRFARDKAISDSQVRELAYTLALVFNGTRPTDTDFRNAVLILNGNSGDRSVALAGIQNSIGRIAGQNMDIADIFINTAPKDPRIKTLLPLQKAANERRAEFDRVYSEAVGRFPILGVDDGPGGTDEPVVEMDGWSVGSID